MIRSVLNSPSSIRRVAWSALGAASLLLTCGNDDDASAHGQRTAWTGNAVPGNADTAGTSGRVSALAGSDGTQTTSPIPLITGGESTFTAAGDGGDATGEEQGASGTTLVTAGETNTVAGIGAAGAAGETTAMAGTSATGTGGEDGGAGQSGSDEEGSLDTDIVNIDLDGTAALIQQGAQITGAAAMEVMGLDLVGLYEWQVKDVIDTAFDTGGADPTDAFAHIVASGPNAMTLHYAGGDRLIQDGDLVLLDIGAMYQGYSSDISRTIPANGTFTPRQREIYQLVLDAQSGAAEAMVPGVQSLSEMTQWVKAFFKASPLRAAGRFGWEQTMDVFFIHEIGHYVGTDVHGSDLNLRGSEPVEIGRVFTLEPGLYIESEGIGIRIEDDFIMTETGAVNIYKNTIKTVEEIEQFMAKSEPSSGLIFYPEAADFGSSEHSGSYTDHMDF